MRKTILLSGLILLAVLIPVFLVCAATYNVDPYSDNMLYEHSVFGINSVRILEDAVDEASSILQSHRLALDELTDLLCEHETVNGVQIDAILDRKDMQGKGKINIRPAPNGHNP